jgi:MFS transporter, DHA1 family, tetracycline resistance protein
MAGKSAPNNSYVRRVTPIFALVFVDVLGLTVILPLLHLYAIKYGASPLEIGLVAAAFPASQLIGVPLMGALSDRFGRKPLLLISQVTTCLGFILLGVANSIPLIILSRVIDGLFGANLATAQAALSDITTEENRAQGLGLTGAAFGLGFILGPAIALGTFEFTNDLSIPAYTAAVYSFISILLTLFMFQETLPPERRGKPTGRKTLAGPQIIAHYLRVPAVRGLLILMFFQQIIFFGFESLLGIFVLSRIGFLAQGNALVLIVVGVVLVMVQARFIGKWTKKYGEFRVICMALAFLAVGLTLVALTPSQAHPLYTRAAAERYLLSQRPSGTESIIGDIQVQIPSDAGRGFGGMFWLFIAVIPVSVGAALIRPSLNSLMTKRVNKEEFGAILGASAALVSAADAVAPLLSGWLFQTYGHGVPYLAGGLLMSLLFALTWWGGRRLSTRQAAT